MAGLAVAVIVLAVSSVGAQAIRRWTTPDGSLYFGNAPPPGSTFVAEVPKLGTVGDGYVPPAPRKRAERPREHEPSPHEAREIDREIRGTWKGMREALTGQPPAE